MVKSHSVLTATNDAVRSGSALQQLRFLLSCLCAACLQAAAFDTLP